MAILRARSAVSSSYGSQKPPAPSRGSNTSTGTSNPIKRYHRWRRGGRASMFDGSEEGARRFPDAAAPTCSDSVMSTFFYLKQEPPRRSGRQSSQVLAQSHQRAAGMFDRGHKSEKLSTYSATCPPVIANQAAADIQNEQPLCTRWRSPAIGSHESCLLYQHRQAYTARAASRS